MRRWKSVIPRIPVVQNDKGEKRKRREYQRDTQKVTYICGTCTREHKDSQTDFE